MKRIVIAFWAALLVVGALWLAADPASLRPSGFFPLRGSMVQLSGILAITCMSLAMVLSIRPRWPEGWAGGVDKMYRLHKWLGIGALVLAILHWLWSEMPKWAVRLGWLERPQRGPRVVPDNAVEQFLGIWRGTAETVGEWAFYAAVVLIAAALIPSIPYRIFYKTHRLLAVVYLALVLHALVLVKVTYWVSPLGIVLAVLLASGTWAALVVLFRRVGAGRKADGTIERLHYDPVLRVIEGDVDVAQGWPGHKPGQFAFVTSDEREGAHPYTIASVWRPSEHRLTFVAKELGDHTRRLPDAAQGRAAGDGRGPLWLFHLRRRVRAPDLDRRRHRHHAVHRPDEAARDGSA